MFDPLPSQVDLPALEHEVLRLWAERKVFARALEQTAAGPRWTFYEGPPTANGKPGTHHVEARAFKDLFPRVKTMQGYHVPRRAGWDCHGLPVELAVEKELGFTGKGDIEAFGVANFNARCRESVTRHVDQFEQMSERMGYWLDFAHPYRTMDASYVESVWWSLKQIYDAGLLVEDHRVAPYCPRCGTALSDHEVAQGYLTVTDPSVYVRFPVTSGRYADQADLLIWTTTPWTLISNTAVAVHPEVDYVAARDRERPGRLLIVAEPLVGAVLGDDAEVVDRFPGRTLEHVSYGRPFDLVDFPGEPTAHYVALADYVTTEDGTGLVHQAPAFGADDLAVARRYGLPVINPVRPDGRFDERLPLVGGQFFKAADPGIVEDLRARGRLYRCTDYEHSYPHCWRCDTPLLYYALPSWYIRTTAIKTRLVEENAHTDWHPATIKTGRYGDWLDNNVDWALSRNRYWGTPLPIWRCPDNHLTCVASRAELAVLAGRDLSDLDPHRPYVDEVTLGCPTCGGVATRVPEVIDAWYDSGSMPFAQWGYPHQPGSAEAFTAAYPAAFIAEGLDQTRGWFYTLMAVGTLVFDRSAYETVLCLGIILAADGRRMSKHLGNILEPIPLMERHGADALRWYMLASGSPWVARRVGDQVLDDVVRKVLLTYWHTAAFFVLYANAAGGEAVLTDPAEAHQPLLDRWLRGELHAMLRDVDAALGDFDAARAGRRLAGFVDELSNWYVRRSRRRFWAGEPAALRTLQEVLEVLTRALAPFVPFITEAVWQSIAAPRPGAPDSVHLASWPTVDQQLIDPMLAEQMALARRLVELGRAARAGAAVKTRQPLGGARVAAPGWATLPAELRDHVADELNVTSVGALADAGDLVDVSVKVNFRALGRRLGPRTKAVAAAVAATDPAVLAAAQRAGHAVVDVDGESVALQADDLVITETPRAGWAVASDAGETVALDLEITPALRRAGLARDAVRLIQAARRSAGLDVSDRIELWWEAVGELVEALGEHGTRVADEVLATSCQQGRPAAPLAEHGDDELGLRFWLRPAGG